MPHDTDPLTIAETAAREWLEGLDTVSSAATAGFETLYARFDAPLPERGRDPSEVVTTLIENTRGGLHGNAGGRFFGWVIGGVTPSALAADWLVSAWDQNAALYHVSPVASVIEQRTGEWLKQLFRLPAESSFAFTTGTQMAHATALAAARHRVLADAGWDVARDGLFGAPRVAIVTGRNRHTSVDRAARLLGFGQASMHIIDTDAETLAPGELDAALAAHAGNTGDEVSVTMTQSTNFVRPVTGDVMLAEGTLVRRAGRTAFTRSVILDPSHGDDPDGQVCATAQCTFKLRQRDRDQGGDGGAT